MADIRINSLSTTASASSSDDFLAIDGTTNGTRKLNAYSPTFGGNLTVSGTDNVFGPAGNTVSYIKLTRNGSVIGGFSSANTQLTLFSGSTPSEQVSLYPSGGLAIGSGHTDPGAGNLQVKGTGTSTFAGNLTVSGTGTSSVAGSFGVGAASPVVGFSGNEAAWIVGANRTDGGGGLYPILLTLNDTRAYNATNPSPGGGLGFTYKYNTAGNYASGVTIQGFKENSTDGDYAGGLRFLTRANAAQPAEAMRITSSGNVLLKSDGVDNGQKLQVSGTTLFTGDVTLQGTSGRFYLKDTGVASSSRNWLLSFSEAAEGDLQFRVSSAAGGDPVSGTVALGFDRDANATFAGRIGLTANGTNTIYSNFIPAATGTYAGSITMQAGGGSAGYGGGLVLFGHSHATRPGWVIAGISGGSGGRFCVNSSGLGAGTDLFTVSDAGNMFIINSTSVPSTNPSGGGFLYVEGGALKYRGSSGTVTTIANA